MGYMAFVNFKKERTDSMNLKILNQKDIKTLTSLEVGEMIEKEHKNLLRDIRGYIEVISTSPKLSPLNYFIESSYQDSKNETRPMYLLSKLGCELVANKMTGEKGILFTALYVQKFNEMEIQKKLPGTYKEALLALIEAEEDREKMQLQLTHKEDVIIGLVDTTSLNDKRQILNRVVKYKGASFQERWRELYKQFEMKYHIDLNLRIRRYNEYSSPKVKNKVDYIDKVMNKIPELYEIAVKLYETDVKALQDELYNIC